jgi:hypothetical protein
VNATDSMGMWPLLAAVKCHNLAMIRLLLDHGAMPKKITRTTTSTELHALADTQKGPFPPVRTPSHTHTHNTTTVCARPTIVIAIIIHDHNQLPRLYAHHTPACTHARTHTHTHTYV